MSGLMVAVLAGLGSVLVLFAGRDAAEAQPIPCEQWQQMHPGWPCADVPTYNPQPTQPPNTGAPAPIIPSLLNPPTGQGGGPGAGALTPPPLQGPPNMNNPIVPVPGYVPPVLPGNMPPPGPQTPQGPDAQTGAPGPEASTPAGPSQIPQLGLDIVTQLQTLAKLHAEGALTDQEFEAAKQRLLQSTPSPATPPEVHASNPVPDSGGAGFDPRVVALLVGGSAAFVAAARPIGGSLIRPVKGDPTPPKDPNPPRDLNPGKQIWDGETQYREQGFETTSYTEWVPDQPGATTGTVRMGIGLLPLSGSWKTDGIDVWVDGQYQHVMPQETGPGYYLIEVPNVRIGQKVQFDGNITGQYQRGRTTYFPEADIRGTFVPGYSVRQRLDIYYERLGQLPPANSADEAFNQVATTLDAVEDQYSGVPRNPNPGLDWDGRMYPPREDYTVQNPDGSLTANTKGSVINIGSNGSIEIISKNSGQVEFFKPGGGA
ncbi:SHOCT domain-containing protein [Nocardia sp. 2]|uniref:SHOCT domain-containing protein n=1 Tax=Nocardia acididurans TaxID=2802282 RepID=A0ABS1MI68_9NOCA|nr:SHOCT domain-containing protein [Nocardia acididurans]MBL1080312.1 SHOCT domain-containing protein [Nocardia acididurans]